MTSLKTAWKTARKNAEVQGRLHDLRHTFITELAESGEAGDETIRDIAGHVSPRMLRHYSHIGMEAKRRAVQALVPKPQPSAQQQAAAAGNQSETASTSDSAAKESAKATQIH